MSMLYSPKHCLSDYITIIPILRRYVAYVVYTPPKGMCSVDIPQVEHCTKDHKEINKTENLDFRFQMGIPSFLSSNSINVVFRNTQ